MKYLTLRMTILASFSVAAALASPCVTAPLATYTNSGTYFTCSESAGAVNIEFNNTILPSYVGLGILPANNSTIDPSSITVAPGMPGLSFLGNFESSGPLLSAQAELAHFTITSATPISDMTFFLLNPQVSAGGLGLGAGVAVGQELMCIGGTFTSLPVGLVTSVTNGVLGTGQYGCNGTTIIGTVGTQVGVLDLITGTLGLPNLTGLSDHVTVQLSPYNPYVVDVIKIQALVSALGGSASTSGFGDSFTAAAVPEPSSALLIGSALVALGVMKRRRMK